MRVDIVSLEEILLDVFDIDIIAFGSDMPQDKEDATETYTFYIDLRENRMNTRKQIHIMSVEKDLYKKTNIRVWNQDKN